jgi:outer membrane protein assembly factor BamB
VTVGAEASPLQDLTSDLRATTFDAAEEGEELEDDDEEAAVPAHAEEGEGDAAALVPGRSGEWVVIRTVGPWQETKNDATGAIYYYNIETLQSQWDVPMEVATRDAQLASQRSAFLAGQSGWEEATDEEGNTYYTHAETGESQWEKPAALSVAEAAWEKRMGSFIEARTTGQWRECSDDHGRTFYFDEESGESTWDKPEELLKAEEAWSSARQASPTLARFRRARARDSRGVARKSRRNSSMV